VQGIHFKTSWWYYPRKLFTCSPFNHFSEKKENTPWYTDVSLYLQMQKYFLGLKKTMTSMSPIDKSWPARPYGFLDGTHKELKRVFHLWRVCVIIQLFRSTINW